MGVQRLSALLKSRRQIYRDIRFRNSRLLVDGCNLIHKLYFGSGLDRIHGGEYAALEAAIEEFVSTLRACGVSPYVVLDGGSDPSDRKLQTVTQRAEGRIMTAHLAAVRGGQEYILPQMASLMFRQTLARLEVPMAQCYGEADHEIAALACEWRCPVLSDDSDFYIFDLPAGLLPIAHFQWEAVERSGSNSYIPCKSYRTSSFHAFFGVQPRLLPVFAALAGNDYVKLQESDAIWAQFAPTDSKEQTLRLEGLLCWLRGFQQPEEALEAALELMGQLDRRRRAKLLQDLHEGMREYQPPPSSLKNFFVHGTAPPLPEVAALVPDWMRLPLTEARLTPDFLDVLLLHRMNLGFPVDSGDMPSAYLTSRPLRQVMYGLLLGRGRRLQVQERDRDGLRVKFVPVQPTFTALTSTLALSSLDKVESSQRLQVLLEALGVTEASLSRLPPQLRLPVAATCFWLHRAQPPPEERLLKVLLLVLSNGDTLRHTAVWPCKQRLDVGVAHSVSQWQACLKNSIHLNQLLCFPLPEPQISRLFEGTLVHQLVHRSRWSGGRLKNFDRSGVELYLTMKTAVQQLHAQTAPTPSEDKKTQTSPQRQPLDDLTADLQQLMYEGEEEEEEAATEAGSALRVQEDLDGLVSVRTRYRTKDRHKRHTNPELVCKQRCRGGDLL
ncbi:single-strand DNA endonuclease ASTE1-like [Pempheris klunzingeri]|uniref:single-strand DNA endonuclease ASTE1-like n=1 Tax=Pempheris klunzingeri TaxID=3127111 RepID=UPI00398028B3